MRKDVRIGLAIGGVLLAVLIVYLLVPKENAGNSNKAQAVAQGGSAAQGGGLGGDASPAATASGTDTAQSPAPPAGSNHDAAPPTTRRDDGSFASGTNPTDTGASGSTPDSSGAQAQGENGDANNSAWDTILKTGVMTPLAATNAPPANDPFADAGKGATGAGASREARTAVGTPSDKLDWNVGRGGASATMPEAGGGSGNAGARGTASGTTVATPHTSATLSPAPSDLKEHKMAQGETFSSIAVSLYGDVKYAREIVKANPTLEPSRVRAGTVIKLPDMATIRASQNAPTVSGHAIPAGATATKAEPAIDPSKEYRVQANDSLHKIALKLYGKADKADAIYDANKEKIGGDPHRIKVGMVLKLPEPPTHSPTATR